jgi:oligopeptide/dipeptide ABC transporter ATP-binding protein
VSALDVSVQAQILNLSPTSSTSVSDDLHLVAHDLSVIRHICDRVAVMYAGRIVEAAATETLFGEPLHPYTRALLASVPYPDPDVPLRSQIEGEPADPASLPSGVVFILDATHVSHPVTSCAPNCENTGRATLRHVISMSNHPPP